MPMTQVTEQTNGKCQTLTPKVFSIVLGVLTEVSYVTYDYAQSKITFDNYNIGLIGKTV
jgi:hypothetical protein